MEGGSATHVSDFVNFVVGDSWSESPTTSPSKKVDVLPIFKGGSLDDWDSDEGDIQSEGKGLASSTLESTVDRTGMEILSSIFKVSSTTSFKASSSTSDTVSKDAILNVSQRLAQVRPVAGSQGDSTLIENLARELVNLSSCDKWLLNRIQTHDFDGTWVSVICGLYQSLYLYRTEIVEEHLLSCRLSNHLVLPKAKVMVLLLRRQHLQNFQRLVTERLLQSSPANMKIHIIETLSNEGFLIESLITSIHHTATQMDTWARDQTLYTSKSSRKLYIELVELIISEEMKTKEAIELRWKLYMELVELIISEEMKTKEAIELQPERRIPLIKLFLANIFHMMVTNSLDFDPGNIERRREKIVFAIEDDKWLWKYLHGLKEASNLLGNWSAIICAFYQGLFLCAWHNNLLSEETKDQCLTILLFRSIHLQNFESELKESIRNILQKLGKTCLEAMESAEARVSDKLVRELRELMESKKLTESRESMEFMELRELMELMESKKLMESMELMESIELMESMESMELKKLIESMESMESRESEMEWKKLIESREWREPIELKVMEWMQSNLSRQSRNSSKMQNWSLDWGILMEKRKLMLSELMASTSALRNWIRLESTGWDPLGGIRLGMARMNKDIQDEHWTRKNYYEIEWERLLKSTLQASIMVTENIVKSCLKEGSHNVNVFLGSSCLPNGIKIEECLDLKLVYDLGGLICTIEGDPGSNEGNDCTSWCIIRHNTWNLYLCMDLKEDEYRNKEHVLDGTIDADYEGVVEVATKDGNTTVKSSELDGSYFDGCIEDFADRRGGKNIKSCAAEALHTLTPSPFLDDFKLKCSVLYMIAMAFLVGKKDHLTLKWKGAAGHIEYQPPSKDTLDQSQRESNRALQKCTLLYTSSGTGFLGQDIIWEGNLLEESGGNMNVKTLVHTDVVKIISGHQSLWKYHKCLSGDFLPDHIEAILAKTQEEVYRKRVRVEEIAALAANKQNSGGGLGIFGAKLEAHHEHRSRRAEAILQKGELDLEDACMYEDKIVSGHLSLFKKDLRSLQVELENGTIGQNDQEIFVVRRTGSRCLQIFACNERPWPGYEDKTYYDFTWITDIVASTEGAAKKIMKDSLKGKKMRICRSSSTLKKKPEIDGFETSEANLLVQKFKQKLQKFENVVVRDQTMCQRNNITWTKPRESNDGWKFIIGNQKDYSKKNYFFKATELQAVVCSATRYTTGGATLRTEIQGINGSDQPSTSSNLVTSSGSCRELCETSQFLAWEPEVTATGRFSTCKAQDCRLQKIFYWG